MEQIVNFRHEDDSSFVGWEYGGEVIRKLFNHNIYALLLKNNLHVLILEIANDNNNVILLNQYGETIKKIENPDKEALCFDDVYYINDELTLFSRRKDASMLAVVINDVGEVIRTYESC